MYQLTKRQDLGSTDNIIKPKVKTVIQQYDFTEKFNKVEHETIQRQQACPI